MVAIGKDEEALVTRWRNQQPDLVNLAIVNSSSTDLVAAVGLARLGEGRITVSTRGVRSLDPGARAFPRNIFDGLENHDAKLRRASERACLAYIEAVVQHKQFRLLIPQIASPVFRIAALSRLCVEVIYLEEGAISWISCASVTRLAVNLGSLRAFFGLFRSLGLRPAWRQLNWPSNQWYIFSGKQQVWALSPWAFRSCPNRVQLDISRPLEIGTFDRPSIGVIMGPFWFLSLDDMLVQLSEAQSRLKKLTGLSKSFDVVFYPHPDDHQNEDELQAELELFCRAQLHLDSDVSVILRRLDLMRVPHEFVVGWNSSALIYCSLFHGTKTYSLSREFPAAWDPVGSRYLPVRVL